MMDPNANLAEQLRIAERILGMDPGDAERLAELVVALDGWLRVGGFLPAAWAKGVRR